MQKNLLRLCLLFLAILVQNVHIYGEPHYVEPEDHKPDVPVKAMTHEEEQELQLYQGCAEKQFTTCGDCLFNGNTLETRTQWCSQPAFCFETTDPNDHMFDMFCRGDIISARSDEPRHTVALRCGEEFDPTFYERHHHNIHIACWGLLTFSILCALSYYHLFKIQRKFYAMLSKDANTVEGRKKDDDISTPTKQGRISLESNRKTPVKFGGTANPVTPVDKAKTWINTLRSPTSNKKEDKENDGNTNKLVTPFASPISKTFCASSDDV